MSELEEQITEQIAGVEGSLTSVDEVFGNLNTLEYDEVVKRMSPLDRAKYDLTNLYAINSLFWMYTRSFGEDPTNLDIKNELDRIKQQMMRVKQIGDKSKMPRVDKQVAQRMIRHELGGDGKKTGKQKETVEDEDWDKNERLPNDKAEEPMETDNQARGRKRKFPKSQENDTEDLNDAGTSTSAGKPANETSADLEESVLSNSDEEYASAQE